MKNMLRAALFAAFAMTTALPSLASAQGAASILVVDMDKVANTSLAGNSGKAQLQTKLNGLQARVKALTDQFRAEEDSLIKARQSNALAQPAFDIKAKDLQARKINAQNEINGRRNDFQRSQDAVKKQIYDAVIPIIQRIRGERGAQIVMSRDAAMDFAAGADITSDVIARLNKTLPSVNANPK